MLTKVIVLQQVEVAHLLSHGDFFHSALVQVELLSHVNVTVRETHDTISSVFIYSAVLRTHLHQQRTLRACLMFSSRYVLMELLLIHPYRLFKFSSIITCIS